MFAKLKKKLEEEVGDLGVLTNPLQNAFSPSSDKRVGGSTQGTNTPNTIGSRQSSLASLVDVGDSASAATSPNSNSSSLSIPIIPIGGQRTNSLVSPQQQQPQPSSGVRSIQLENELKKVNTEWTKKVETLKKSYDDKFQELEADFAWKISGKDEELEKLREDKKRLNENIKLLEESYTSKLSRFHEDMGELEGFSQTEMNKIKELLHNTQADLQTAQAELVEKNSELKQANEINRNLKVENETILRNLDRDRLQSIHFENELKTKTEELEAKSNELIQLNQKFADLNSSNKQLLSQFKQIEESNELLNLELSELTSKVRELTEASESEQIKSLELENQLRATTLELESKYAELIQLNQKNLDLNLSNEQLLSQLKEFEVSSNQQIEELKLELSGQTARARDLAEASESERIKSNEIENLLKAKTLELESKSAELIRLNQRIEELSNEQLITHPKDVETSNELLNLEISELTSKVRKLTDANESERLKSNELENQLKAKTLELESKSTEISQLNQKFADLVFRNEQLLSQLKEFEVSSKQQIEERDLELSELTCKVQKLTEESESERFKSDGIENQLRVKTLELESKSAELLDLNQKFTNLNSRNEQLLSQSEAYSKQQIEDINLEISELTSKVRELTEANESEHLKSCEIKNHLKTKLSELESKSAELIQLNKTIVDLNYRNEQLLSQVKEFEVSSNQQIEELKSELSNLTCQVEKLTGANESEHLKSIELEHQLKVKTLELESKSAELLELNQKFADINSSNEQLIIQQNEVKVNPSNNSSNTEECDKCNELEEKLNEYEQFGSELELASKQSEIKQLNLKIFQLSSKVQELADANESERLKSNEIELKLRNFETTVEELQRKNLELQMEKETSKPPPPPSSPAVIESSNSFHLNSPPKNALTEDVNFQYMKSVIFKFVTTSDPQVTQHLTKVVSTLLHLTPEENRMLEKSSDKRVLSWIGSGREHHY